MSTTIALKYRPKSFEDLIGQEMISNTLSLALDNNKLVHAYLFSGLRGSGKTSTARIFAKAMLCSQRPTSKPCEVCDNCQYAAANKHPDIIELDAASHRGIDDVRDIIEQSKYNPTIGRFKIFIIDEAHMITYQAFNAFLKTLEEPGDTTKFILATTDPLKIPSTILSRAQHFRFKSISTKEVINRVVHILGIEQINYDIEAIKILARSGKGSLRDTLTLLEQAIIYGKNSITVAGVTEMLGLIEPSFIDEFFNALFKKDMDRLKAYILELEVFELETVIDELSIYLKERLMSGDERFSVILIDRFFRVLSDSKHLLFINSSPDFVLSLMVFKFIEALKTKEINRLIDEIEHNNKPYIKENKPVIEPSSATASSMATASPTPQTSQERVEQQPQTQQQEQQSDTPNATAVNDNNLEKNHSEQNSAQEKFQELLVNIYDRNTEVGDCFKSGVSFVSYENETLTLSNNVTDEASKKTLRLYSAQIRKMVKDIFGIETQIVFISPEPQKSSLEPENPDKNSDKNFDGIPSKPTAPSAPDSSSDVSPASATDPEVSDEQPPIQEPMEKRQEPIKEQKIPAPLPDSPPPPTQEITRNEVVQNDNASNATTSNLGQDDINSMLDEAQEDSGDAYYESTPPPQAHSSKDETPQKEDTPKVADTPKTDTSKADTPPIDSTPITPTPMNDKNDNQETPSQHPTITTVLSLFDLNPQDVKVRDKR